MKKIVFTGGHHTSALVVAKDLQRAGFQIIWLGHKYTMKNIGNVSLEWQEVNQARIPFIELKTGKIHKGNLLGWWQVFKGFLQALIILVRVRPKLIVAFGGYLAVPAAMAGFLLGIPIVIHEQTTTAGLANRFLKRLARKIFITWPESKKFFPAQKTSLIGLPLRQTILKAKKKPFFKNKRKTILITGGKQGSHTINQTIYQLLPKLLDSFNVIHQAGETSTTNDLEKLEQLKQSLTKKKQRQYKLVAYLNETEMGQAYKEANCVICRSGAHTVYELLVLGKPAILIPFPFSFAAEQQANAQKLVTVGLGIIIKQKQLTPRSLLEAIERQLNLPGQFITQKQQRAKKLVSLTGREEMVDYLKELLNN